MRRLQQMFGALSKIEILIRQLHKFFSLEPFQWSDDSLRSTRRRISFQKRFGLAVLWKIFEFNPAMFVIQEQSP